MSFGDHLDELRRRVLWALAVPVPLAFVLFFAADPLIRMLYRPLASVLADLGLPRELQALGPTEAIGTQIKLSLIGAAALSAPWILWQAWLFVRPGLYRHEQRFARLLVRFSVVLTAAGLCLTYFAMLPLILQILVRFGTGVSGGAPIDPRTESVLQSDREIPLRFRDPESPRPGDAWQLWGTEDVSVAVDSGESGAGSGAGAVEIIRVHHPGPIITQQFRLSTYINFVLLLLLGTVVAFQMPLVILLLGWMGVITPKELRSRRRYALFITAIVAAVVTPPDALSMLVMLVPLYGLYELSIVLMVLMPASAVAEGAVWRRLRRWPRAAPAPEDGP